MLIKDNIKINIYEESFIFPRKKNSWEIKEGLYTLQGEDVLGSGKRRLGGPQLVFPSIAFSEIENMTINEKPCIYIGFLMQHFGHMIIEGTASLWG